eukprot:TRINITY_DN49846_c0_g1_i1.p1 TRINITY_DN49846_c0_g1~~TRINITY_DN49846_c0_g1_i1.p1  ORF type:complete len:117 (+),score=14.01 TRINITY_DN49846_c0_g1_i1:122-472(+)
MDIIVSTLIVAQNEEGKLTKEGLVPDQDSRNKYSECVSRGLMKSLGIGSITFATMYFGQKYFTRNIKGMRNSMVILSSTAFAGVSAYLTGTAAMKECNKSFNKNVKFMMKHQQPQH